MSDNRSTLISAEEALSALDGDDQQPLFVDCRFDLNNSDAGQAEYDQTHIPGAMYANLDSDLSAPVGDGSQGRHPLPDPDVFCTKLRAWGLNPDRIVIAYDSGPGMFASRLWWMLNWIGHCHAFVLDGGLQSWKELGGPLTAEVSYQVPGSFEPTIQSNQVVDAAFVEARLHDQTFLLVDARDKGRFTGSQVSFDPRVGHIPGAINHPYQSNLGQMGVMLKPHQLQDQFARDGIAQINSDTVMYCGSGVSACHNILAAVHAGYARPRLYPGSWSEWSADPKRPTEVG